MVATSNWMQMDTVFSGITVLYNILLLDTFLVSDFCMPGMLLHLVMLASPNCIRIA